MIDLTQKDVQAYVLFRELGLLDGYNKTLLSIGSMPPTDLIADFMVEQGFDITVLEVWPPYIAELKKKYKVVEGDIRDIHLYLKEKFDVVLWWHGPEHIKKEELPSTLEKIKKITKQIFVCCVPWGKLNSFDKGNVYLKHLWEVEPKDFMEVGLNLKSIGISGQPNSVIYGWYKK